MKRKKNEFNYLTALKYATLFVIFLIFDNVGKNSFPYSFAVFATSVFSGCSIFFTPLPFLTAVVITSGFGYLASAAIFAGFLVLVNLIYKKFGAKMRLELCVYAALGMTGFILLGNTETYIPLQEKIISVIFTTFLTFLCDVTARTITKKGLKFKLGYEEFATVSVLFVVMLIGLSNLTSPLLVKGLAAFSIVLTCRIYKKGYGLIVGAVFGISLAVYYGNVNYVSAIIVWALAAESFMPLSRFFSAAVIPAADYLQQFVFGVYGEYTMYEFLPVAVGVAVFCMIPDKPLKALKEKLYAFREKQLARQSINRNRTMLANRLYELSGVFYEMSDAFNVFKQKAVSEESAKISIEREILTSVCQTCDGYVRCKKNDNAVKGISKMTDIGLAKGKLSLIDMPKELGETCIRPNNVLFGLNKALAEYRSAAATLANNAAGREILADEASGIAEILRELAVDSGTLLKYQNRTERLLSQKLFENGFAVTELLIFGENDDVSVSIILSMKEFSLDKLTAVIGQTLNKNMEIKDKSEISDDKCYLSFVKASEYDAVFGVTSVTKDGSVSCGDTHSVTRISKDKFLMALADGMGSGLQAETVSSVSLSLIESFYKAGMKSNLILNTVNKLLSINTEDSFTALDVTVVDLNECSADFIKYGSPYGFIINDDGIKIIEGNTLPLGILSELKPSVCKANLSPGDTILLVTDGISDSFGSSAAMIDFIRTLPAKNPQTLADTVMKKALEITDGAKNDDMTALAVRIFKKTTK